jgi:hypothetical protein
MAKVRLNDTEALASRAPNSVSCTIGDGLIDKGTPMPYSGQFGKKASPDTGGSLRGAIDSLCDRSDK